MGVPPFLRAYFSLPKKSYRYNLASQLSKKSLSNHTFRTVYFGSNMSQIRKKEA
jgi:hypothetical protein